MRNADLAGARVISQTTEHALRALLYLARQNGQSVKAADIAVAIGAPANYLGKTLQILARHGWLQGTRGPAGGFRLERSPSAISIADIAAVFKEDKRTRMCLLGGRRCSQQNACSAHARWLSVESQSRDPLRNTTLTNLLETSTSLEAI